MVRGEAPFEAIERLHGAERRLLRPRGEVAGVAFAALEQNNLLDDLDRRQPALGRVSEEREQRVSRCAQANAAEGVCDVDGHDALRGWSYWPRS